MLAENISNKEEKFQQKTCEYQGVTYIVMTDMETKRCFINVGGKRMFLDCNGNVANKQPGGRNAKDCVNSYEDMRRIYHHLLEQKRWNIYLLYVLNCNFGRRIGDLLNAKWSDMFDEKWRMRKFWKIKKEQKTKKPIDLKINKAVQIAFKTYFENETAFEKNEKTYNQPIFTQLHGTHKGSVLSQEGYRKALIKIENELKLDKKLRSHAFRRGFFTNLIESHPNDPKAKIIAMDFGNWSSEQMMVHYVGESEKNKEKYLDEAGYDFEKYVINGEEVPFQKKVPHITCNTSKLLSGMREAAMYFMIKGIESANETDPKVIMNTVNEAMKKVEEMLEDITEE